jgi:amino acid adenylation domain-containing protein
MSPRPADPGKLELIRLLLEEQGLAAPAAGEPIGRREAGAGIPLSFAQQRMWFLHQVDPGGCGYNLCGAVRLRGALDAAALQASVTEILSRHELLRTSYRLDGHARPVQAVARPAGLPVPVIELPATASREEVAAAATAAARRPFDLSRGLPLRALLLKLGPAHHVLVLTLHHIAFDDRSWAIMLSEFARLYQAFRAGQASPLPPLPLQYADFACWQRAQLDGDAQDRARSYWRDRLTPPPAALPLATDHPRPAALSADGARSRAVLPESVTQALRSMGRDEGATLFMILLAAVATWLHRYTAATDIAVGTPAAHRARPELEALIGNFTNTLVMRTDTSGDPTFRELLGRVRETSTAGYAHQDLPFEVLVAELQPQRTLNRSPLFDVAFAVRTDPLGHLLLPGLDISEMPVDTGTSRFDLSVEAMERAGGGLALAISYRTQLFAPATIERMLRHLTMIAKGAAAGPDRRLSELPALTAVQRRQLTGTRDHTARDWRTDLRLHRLVENQAGRSPDATAVVFGTQQLTYAQLNARAGQLARRLRELGAGRGTAVGVHLDRSAELVTGLLAVLKTGAAVVPLDPALPARRLAAIGSDAGLVAVLSSPAKQRDPVIPGVPAVDPAARQPAPGGAAGDLGAPAGPGDLAYIMYTSGSTGRPKGVMIPHRGIANRVLWQAAELGLTAADVVLHKTPLSFDVSIGEIFLPLVAGARLVVAPPGLHADPRGLLSLVCAERVTFMNFVPAMLDIVLDEPDAAAMLACVKHVWCGGDVLTPGLCQRFRAKLDATLYNGYGPTEASVGATWRAYPPGSEGPPSIGRPIANASAYILDARLRPVPPGMPGELCLGGMPVALGYLNRPELTAACFVPDPFSGVPGARLYRTGDLARYLPNEEIDFLGRADRQVKVRGVRVEPAEIEAVLCEHPAVRRSAVVPRAPQQDAAGPAGFLDAYYMTRPQEDARLPAELWPAELRGWLRARLPEHMVPQTYTRVDDLPLTPAGKLDRDALPAPGRPAAGMAGHLEPRDRLEQGIAAAWRQVLGGGRVGARDNFFDLGGHSLLLIGVQRLLRSELGLQVPVVDLFSYPTVESLARHLAHGNSGDQEAVRRRALRQQAALARHRAALRPEGTGDG